MDGRLKESDRATTPATRELEKVGHADSQVHRLWKEPRHPSGKYGTKDRWPADQLGCVAGVENLAYLVTMDHVGVYRPDQAGHGREATCFGFGSRQHPDVDPRFVEFRPERAVVRRHDDLMPTSSQSPSEVDRSDLGAAYRQVPRDYEDAQINSRSISPFVARIPSNG